MSTDLAKLVVRLEAEIGRYHKELDRARKETRSFHRTVKGEVAGVKKIFASFLAIFTVATVTSFYAAHAQGIDRLAKQSSKMGLVTEQLQAIRFAGELTGVGINTTDMALQRMTRRVAEAARGTGEAKDALRELDLDARKLATLTTDQQFAAIADAMQSVEKQGDRVRLSMKLFDSEGVALVNTLALGSAGLIDARGELDSYGASITRIDAAKIEHSNDQFTRADKLLGAFGTRMAVETAPILSALATKFLEAAQEAGGMGSAAQNASRMTVTAVGFAADTVRGLKIGWMGVRQMVAEVIGISWRLATTISKFGAGVADKLGFNPQGLQSMAEFFEGFTLTVDSMRAKLHAEIMRPMPSETIKAWVEDIQIKSQIAAQELAAENGGLQSLLMGPNDLSIDSSPEALREAERNKIIEGLRKSHLTKLLRLEAQADLKALRFQRSTSAQKVRTVINEGVQITQGASHTSKKLFKLNKALALADAAVTLPSAVLKAIERGGGLPWGAVFGALTLANGLAQIRAIRSQSFSGGTSASFAGTGGGATPVTDVDTPLTDIADPDGEAATAPGGGGITLIIQDGAVVTDVAGLVDQLNEYVANNGQLNATAVVT